MLIGDIPVAVIPLGLDVTVYGIAAGLEIVT
jgi:hypothetical protein